MPTVRPARELTDRRRSRAVLWLALALGAAVVVAGAGLLIWRDDILEALLNPKIPYAVYKPPTAPDYLRSQAWARLPGPPEADDPPADVFFIHPTTFDGGRDWNGPIDDRASARRLVRQVLPNYAEPFADAARLFVPRYRQASLYTSLSLFDDALDARVFAYGDIERAFRNFLGRIGPDRPFFIVGAEQGGELAARLLTQVVAADPRLRARLVAGYLIEAATPADEHGAGSPTPACIRRDEAGCLVAWISAERLDFVGVHRILTRSVVWTADGRLVGLAGRLPLCVNPLMGAQSEADAPLRLNLGAANATGLESGTQPGFMARQVSARCEGGVLRFSRPRSASLRPSGDWADRVRLPGYNLFWADLQADAQARLEAWLVAHPLNPPPAADPPAASRTRP